MIDITGVATIDRTVANHLVQTVEASRLMGASTILTGLSSEIAQTLVDLGVDLGMMKTVGTSRAASRRPSGWLATAVPTRPSLAHDRRLTPRADVGAILRRATSSSPPSSRTCPTARSSRSATTSPGWSGSYRSRGIVIDVAALDVIDSFVARALRAIVLTARLRGAETVIVGIQPDVAIAMVQFRLNLEPLRAALDLDAGEGAARSADAGGRGG